MQDKQEESDEYEKTPLCTFAVTGNQPFFQPIYICHTCNKNNECVCESCADNCHEEHDVDYIGIGPCCCDCSTSTNSCCLLIEKSKQVANSFQMITPQTQDDVLLRTTTTNNKLFPYHVTSFDISTLQTSSSLCQHLIRECEQLVDCTKETHWIPLSASDPQLCGLEKLALLILKYHALHTLHLSNTNTIGAEWWVQVKPPSNSSIDLHYDKDETLAETFGLGSFPTLSTVTYLTSSSKQNPTILFPHCYHESEDSEIQKCILSYPYPGKHLAFDGRLLHGAPSHPSLLTTEDDSNSSVRITFLVNIWLKGPPVGVACLPKEVRSSLLLNCQQVQLPHSLEVGPSHDSSSFQYQEITNNHEARLELPFLSAGATWINDDDSDEDSTELVMTMVPPTFDKLNLQTPKDNASKSTVLIVFGDGCEAQLKRIPKKK